MRQSLALFSVVWLVSCDQPPTRELAAAETALTQAREAEADKYAPNRFREAEAALNQAKQRVDAKDYRAALSSANDATDRAKAAAKAAATAKTLAQSGTDLTLAQIQAALDEALAEREAATATGRHEAATATGRHEAASRIPPEVFSDPDRQLEEVKQQMAAVRASLAAGQVLEAQTLAAEAKPRAGALRQAYTDARTRWEAEHPARKGKPARKK